MLDSAPAPVVSRFRVPRAKPAWAAMACLVWILSACAGCYWLRYHDLLRTHVELMEQVAADAGAGLAAGHGVLQPADIERLRYPLERARSFAAISTRRFGGAGSADAPASLGEFEAFIGAYATLVDDLDRSRVSEIGAADLARVRQEVDQVRALGKRVRDAIDRER